MTSLLLLYASVLVPVYSEWIKIEDLCFLDTAVCNQQLRNMFQGMLTFCHNTEEVIEGSKVFVWMMLRGVRVRKLSVVSWTPVVNALIQSRFLSFLTIELDKLPLCLESIQKSIENIAVRLSHSFDQSHLKIVGSAITELILMPTYTRMTESEICTIAACCPNLRKVSAEDGSFVLPLVDACQLDEINSCHLDSLVRRQDCDWPYSCNLRRTSAVDETAVCLGEGKYYHVTALHYWNCNKEEKDADLLIPLMSNLIKLTITGWHSGVITSAAVEKCHNLTELTFRAAYYFDISPLLQQSPLLRVLHVSNNCSNVDVWIDTVSESCPLLENCSLTRCVVESGSAMSALFSKCHFLTEFSARSWPVDSVVPFAVSCETLVIVQKLCARKSARGLRKLEIPKQITKEALCSLFVQNPGIVSVDIAIWSNDLSCVIKALVQSCSLLTSLDVNSAFKKSATLVQSATLVPLGCLVRLKCLTVGSVVFTVESVSAMLQNKASSLHSLTLSDCNITSDMVAVIGRLCPALTSLNLNDNPDIQNADVVYLLNSCTKLEVLSLQFCRSITSEVLSSIKSPPMRHLNVCDTGICKSDMMRFKSVVGFKYCI